MEKNNKDVVIKMSTDNFTISVKRKILDDIFGTPEEIIGEPKGTYKFSILDLNSNERDNKGSDESPS